MIRSTLFTIFFLIMCTQPTAAQQDTLQAKITPLTDNIYVHTSFRNFDNTIVTSNGLIAETPKGAILVDTGWDDAQTIQILDWIDKNLGKPLTLAIITHSHDDRSAGVDLLRRRHIRVISTAKTAQKLRNEGHEHTPAGILPPDSTFSVDQTSVTTYFPGEGHTEDNIVVWFPDQRVLFGGCLVRSTETNSLGNTAEANMEQWSESIRNVIKRFPDPEFVVPGHFSWEDSSSLLHTLELLK